jgi:phosphopantothenoylcysteine decarboxylase/phosphopantothenate--cysteine ligase
MFHTTHTSMMNKNILLGITGCIAAYKSAELIRRLRKQGNQIKVIMTDAAKEFITPLTLQTLSVNIVYDDLFKRITDVAIKHIELARWADALIIAPASANFIAKLAHGHADDLLTTVCLATDCKIAIAPAMNKNMWFNPVTQENINKLTARGLYLFGPEEGTLACDETGYGRMLEPEKLTELISQLFENDQLKGYRPIITAGPTREHLDPVRYITNHSSGKMGYALATAASEAGAHVTLISGPTMLPIPPKVELVSVTTAQEMYTAVMNRIKDCDLFIATAAVADYSPLEIFKNKIKKTQDTLTVELQANPDILASVAALHNAPFTVGFAAETENVLEYAREKLKNKKIDLMIANQVGPDQGFDCDDNTITILQKNQEPIEFPKDNKLNLARKIIEMLAAMIPIYSTTKTS